MTTGTLDFSALTARHYRPARVAQITPRSALVPTDNNNGNKNNNSSTTQQSEQPALPLSSTTAAICVGHPPNKVAQEPITQEMKLNRQSDGTMTLVPISEGETDDDDNYEIVTVHPHMEPFPSSTPSATAIITSSPPSSSDIDNTTTTTGTSSQRQHQQHPPNNGASFRLDDNNNNLPYYDMFDDDDKKTKSQIDTLARSLCHLTDLYQRHTTSPTQQQQQLDNFLRELTQPPPSSRRQRCSSPLPPKLHEIELSDWEKQINWDGDDQDDSQNSKDCNLRKKNKPSPSPPLSPRSFLSTPTNPSLENLLLDGVDWDGNPRNVKTPLILQQSLAGTSLAPFMAPHRRPLPFSASSAFIRRFERQNHTSGASNPMNSLNPDNEKMEAIIAARQAKRAQMAIDKSHRVIEAMGTLALGGGKGRTITSSLMGPGGTERTGRPSRHAGSSSAHDAEYVEQLDLVYNHTLVKPDLRKSELRQFHRPRLIKNVCGANWTWQLQYRVNIQKDKKGKTGDGSIITAQSSSQKIRNEADLSPGEDDLILLEYSEERPPLLLMKGMCAKIVNYYRGDKSRCPISRGGGDRPVKKKRGDGQKDANDQNNKNNKINADNNATEKNEISELKMATDDDISPSTLIGDWRSKKKDDNETTAKDKDKDKDKDDKESSNILPEGITEILHPKVHGPFIGEVEENTTQSGLISNLFAAPLFRHDPYPTDFLLILGKKPSYGSIIKPEDDRQTLYVQMSPLPKSTFTVGQTEPKQKVFAPNTTGEKSFSAPFVTYQIAKALARTQQKEGRGLRFDEINDRLFANTALLPNALRQRIKQVAMYDKNTQIWTQKPIGFEDYPGVEAWGRRFTPEGVAAYESACAAVTRMCDLGIRDLHSGSSSVASVAAAMLYLNGSATAARERKSKMTQMAESLKRMKNQMSKQRRLVLYEKAAERLEESWKDVRRKQDIARFIYEELQLAPWHLTAEFIEVHKNAQGTAMMKLTGLGDPSGRGEAYNFLREVDAKPNKGTGNSDGALNAQIKKITGTENDLRKLTMKQMASLLRSYGMGQKEIDTLKRWDRVHCIRDLSTKAASDGMGDGLERYARGEKMKLSDQKQMYRDRIQEIWRRQRSALSTDAGLFDARLKGVVADDSTVAPSAKAEGADKTETMDGNDSDSDSDDDDSFAALLEEDMLDVRKTNELMAETTGTKTTQLSAAEDAQEMSKDAQELAALKRKLATQKEAQEGLLNKNNNPSNNSTPVAPIANKGRKVIRRRITRTHPDGTQTTTFKFITREDEVNKIITQKKKKEANPKSNKHSDSASPNSKSKSKKAKDGASTHSSDAMGDQDKRTVGHAMFEDEDDTPPDSHSSRHKPNIVLQLQRSTRVVNIKTKKNNRTSNLPPKPPPPPSKFKTRPKLQLAKLKQKVSQENRKKKRKREAEEADLYSTAPQRKGTSNRRERGAARDRMPHVIMSDRIEAIRLAVEKRSGSGPFHRPVNRRQWPRYYEVISKPIDLQTIRDKNNRYEYRLVDSFVADFDLMKSNAIKFNGVGSLIGNEATAIYDYVRERVELEREDFNKMEAAVREQLSGSGRNKKSKKAKTSGGSSSVVSGKDDGASVTSAGSSKIGVTANVVLDGVATTVNLGDISTDLVGGDDTDSDDSEKGLVPL